MAGALAALTATPALAAPPPVRAVSPASSYAELLDPIPNAVERLKQADSEAAERPRIIQVQDGGAPHHHHHHHHHHSRGWYIAHGYVRSGGTWVLRPVHHHHHHHHHHHDDVQPPPV
jgi:hypothetical protein